MMFFLVVLLVDMVVLHLFLVLHCLTGLDMVLCCHFYCTMNGRSGARLYRCGIYCKMLLNVKPFLQNDWSFTSYCTSY